MDLAKTTSRPRRHPTKVVRELVERHGDRAESSGGIYETVARALCLEVVAGLGERQPGTGCQQLDHPRCEARRGVQPCADSRTSKR